MDHIVPLFVGYFKSVTDGRVNGLTSGGNVVDGTEKQVSVE